MPGPWRDGATLLLAGDYTAAAECYERLGCRPGEASVRLLAASDAAAAGRRAELDEQLGRALAFYRSVGATRFVREAEQLLPASA
jgi:hypothetical protein